MKRLLLWLTALLPYRVYSDGGVSFLERYFLFKLFGVTAYVHRFVASDPDRGLHDHPWGWAWSFVLSGHYFELTQQGLRPVRWFNRLRGDTFHRVCLPTRWRGAERGMPLQEVECWTLFIHGPNVKRWGFLREIEDGRGACFYRQHVDRDGSEADSAAWAKTAGRRPG